MKQKKSCRNPDERINTQIALASISLCLSTIFLSLTYVFPFMSILNIIVIPFSTAYFAIKSNYKGQLIFLICTFFLCFIDIQEGFFCLLPNTIIGLVYGDFFKTFKASFITYFFTMIVSFIVELLLILPIKAIFSVDMLLVYSTVLNLKLEVFTEIYLLFYLLLSVIQTLIIFIIISNEIQKLNIKTKAIDINPALAYPSLLLPSLAVFIIFIFFNKKISYLFLGLIVLIVSNYTSYLLFMRRKWLNYAFGASIILSIALFFILSSFLSKENIYLSFFFALIPCIILSLFMVIYYRIKKSFPLEIKGSVNLLLEEEK